MKESHALGLKSMIFFGEYFQNTTYICSTGKAQAGILKVQGPPGNHLRPCLEGVKEALALN